MTKTRALDNLGAHLLGRKPLPPDDRDYKLEQFLDAHERLATSGVLTPSVSLQQLVDEGVWEVWHDTYAVWAYVKSLLGQKPTPPSPGPTPTPPSPTPTPPAPSDPVEWADTESVLDQGQTPHCVGFTGADWMNTLPVDDRVGDSMGTTLYYACKVIDGEPKAEDGSHTRSLCKALQQMGRIGAYAFTTNAQTVVAYVRDHGPVMTGIPWTQDMFTPLGNGYLTTSGGIAGGHEISVIGEAANGYGSVREPSVEILNHWGAGWGRNGRAYLTVADYQQLLDQGGDAAAGLELPLSA